MVIRWFCYASHTNNLIHSADAWKNAADLRFAAACWTWPVTTGACKEESSKCYHHSLISLDLPEINIKLNIHLYIIIYMHIFMTKSHFWCQKIPIGFIQLLLESPSKYHPKSNIFYGEIHGEFSTTGRFIAEIPAIFGSPAQLLTSYVVAADAWL